MTSWIFTVCLRLVNLAIQKDCLNVKTTENWKGADTASKCLCQLPVILWILCPIFKNVPPFRIPTWLKEVDGSATSKLKWSLLFNGTPSWLANENFSLLVSAWMHWNECMFQHLGGISVKLYCILAYSSVERCRCAPPEELWVESRVSFGNA